MNEKRRPDWDDIFLPAAIEPDRWLSALAQLADHTGSSHGQLIGIGGARNIPFNLVSNFKTDDLQAFVDMDGGSRDINFRIAANENALARGHYDPILYERDYDAVMPEMRALWYREWCEEVGIPFGCQTNLVVDRVGLIGFAVLRNRRDGVTTPHSRKVFAQAATAARRAVRLQERIEGNQSNLLAGAFEAMSMAAFIIDARGRVQAMTPGAEELVSAGHVRLADRRIDARGTPHSLGQAVSALIADEGPEHVRLRLDTPLPQQPIFLEGFRLPVHAWSLGALPHAILLHRAPQRDRAGIASLLGLLYRLSAAEADIAIRLFNGDSRDEICAVRGVTGETLRGQIKAIYAKTSADNEAGLMRTLAAIMS